MKGKLGLAVLVVALLALAGCAAHNPHAFRTVLDPNCLVAPIVIEDCDLSQEPVSCRKIRLRYRRGCEKIEVVQAKK